MLHSLNQAGRRAGIGLFLGLLMGAGPAWAREGYVRLADGAVHEGQLRFESNAVIVVSAVRGVRQRFVLTNVSTVGLAPATDSDRVRRDTFADGSPGWPWQGLDVGAVAEAGRADGWAGGLRVRTLGTNLLGRNDSFHFVHRAVEGPGQWVGRVMDAGRARGGGSTRVGFVVREDLQAGGRQMVLLAGGGESEGAAGGSVMLGVRWKPGDPVQIAAERPVTLPIWIKLARVGTRFTAFTSRDGRRWALLGRAHLALPDEVLAGIGAAGDGTPSWGRIEHVREGRTTGHDWYTPQVRLVGGSLEVGAIESVDESLIQFAGGRQAAVARKTVASIRFRPPSEKVARALHSGQPGVFLQSGEFVAGEIRGLRGGQVTVSSIPLGLLHFDVGAEVMALVFRPAGPVDRLPCRVVTADGSVWLASRLAIEGDWVVFRDAAYGVRRVALYEVVELRWDRTA